MAMSGPSRFMARESTAHMMLPIMGGGGAGGVQILVASLAYNVKYVQDPSHYG